MADVDVVLELAGPVRSRVPVPGAVVVLGAQATVVLADAGDDPEASTVWNHEEFRLLGPGPASVAERFGGGCGCGGNRPVDLPFHLAVRLGDRCIYLGTVQRRSSHHSGGELVSGTLRIDPPLSDETLALVRPPGPAPDNLPGLRWLDHVDTDPGRALESFVTGWYPAVAGPHLPTRVPGSVPRALRDFCRLSDTYPAVLGRQNDIFLPKIADNHGEQLLIGSENQGVWLWSIPWQLDAADTDPTVWHTRENHPPTPEPEPLSRFLLHFTLHEAVGRGPYTAHTHGPNDQLLPRLESFLRRVPLRMSTSPSIPADVLVGPGLVALTSPATEATGNVVVAAHHRSALEPLGRLGIPWHRYDG